MTTTATTERATQLLTGLGTTEQAVAATLTAAGITGDDNCSSSCAVVNYLLHSDLAADEVFVSEHEVTLHIDGQVAYVDVPPAVVEFIRSFDVGVYPHLLSPARRGTPAALMDALTAQVLRRYAAEIHDATTEQLHHLSERFETLPRSPFACRVRDMADAELALRAHTGGAL